MSKGLGLLLGAAILGGGCGGGEPRCSGACATLRLSAPEFGEVTLDQLAVVIRVGDEHRRLLFRERTLDLPMELPLPLPEMDAQPARRAALYLRATWDGGVAPVGLSGAVEWAGERRSAHDVPLRRACAEASCPSPGERRQAALAYDPRARRAVLYGGARQGGVLGDTWEWDGASWQEVRAAAPPARAGHAMAYDPQRGRVIVFGGTGAGGTLLGDTWEYLGRAAGWRLVSSEGPAPRSLAALATAPVGPPDATGAAPLGVLLFGGAGPEGPLGDSWTWDGRGARWVLRIPSRCPSCCDARSPSVEPTPRCRAAAALAMVIGRGGAAEAILVGGVSGRSQSGLLYDDVVWRWDGVAWSAAAVAAPPTVLRRSGHRLVPTGPQQLLLAGGETDGALRQDAFLIDLRRGLFLPQLGAPPASRSAAAATLDEERGEVVLTGGQGGSGDLADTWLFQADSGWVRQR